MSNSINNVMIDLETMALTPNSAIVSIGAVVFDPGMNVVTKNTFYEKLDWKSQNRHLDWETIQWWKKQKPHTRKELDGHTKLKDMLENFELWLPDDAKVWGNGSVFDIAILQDAYRTFNMDIPWKFWNVCDCRTVKHLFESSRGGFDRKVAGTAHNALHDAENQAHDLCKMWCKILGGNHA